MIDSIRRWLSLGLLAAAGCASTVKEEEFLAYRRNADMTVNALRDQISDIQKKKSEADIRYDALLKQIQDLSARISVSSLDNYAIAVEEQTTQFAKQYLQLARTIAALNKKSWESVDATASEINKLRTDTKSLDDTLAAQISELKKLLEETKKAYETFKNDDYKIFKEQNLQETSEHGKKLVEFERTVKNLERVVRVIEKQPDHAKALEESGESATEYACAELNRQMIGFKGSAISPMAGYATREEISRILVTPVNAELVERVLGNMAVGELGLDSKMDIYSKGIDVLSKVGTQDERLYGSIERSRAGMLMVRDALIISKLKSLVGEEQLTVMGYVDSYAKFSFICRQQNDNRVLIDLFNSADLGEVLLTFDDGKLAIVQTGQDGTYAALLPQEQFKKLPTDEVSQRAFERDRKSYINEREELKRSYNDAELQQQIDILRKKYERLFEIK